MPRVSRETSDSNRLAITDASSRLFRERGFKGVSVADLMGAAGLTHGGFYGHFDSKDALAAEACSQALGQSVERWNKRVAGKADGASAIAAIAGAYLSPQSRNHPGDACAIATLANDVAREPLDAPVRAAYLEGLEALVGILSALQETGDPALDRRHALADFSTLVGALVLARATSGQPISDELLAAGRERLLAASSANQAMASASASMSSSPKPARRKPSSPAGA